MKHGVKTRKLGRRKGQRDALMASMAERILSKLEFMYYRLFLRSSQRYLKLKEPPLIPLSSTAIRVT